MTIEKYPRLTFQSRSLIWDSDQYNLNIFFSVNTRPIELKFHIGTSIRCVEAKIEALERTNNKRVVLSLC